MHFERLSKWCTWVSRQTALPGFCLWSSLVVPMAALSMPQAWASAPAPAAHAAKHHGGMQPSYGARPQAMAAALDIAERRGLPTDWVQSVIAQARLQPQVVRLMQPPPTGTAKNWHLYRSRFVEPRRIQAGVRFWQSHRSSLERAEQRYGVPAAIIVGILGVETLYGQHMGRFRVIDALTTLAFDFPANHPRSATRAAFFQQELEHFLTLHHRAGTDPLQDLGSYAGAQGLPQFMPSSRARYAVDFDDDGVIDLTRSAADAIGSVAHYLQAFGWQTSLPTHYATQVQAQAELQTLLAPDILPSFSPAAFVALGAQLDGAALQHPGLLALIELQNGADAPSYVAGTENFYALTRYNWSSYYAMAVIELGQAVQMAVAAAQQQGNLAAK